MQLPPAQVPLQPALLPAPAAVAKLLSCRPRSWGLCSLHRGTGRGWGVTGAGLRPCSVSWPKVPSPCRHPSQVLLTEGPASSWTLPAAARGIAWSSFWLPASSRSQNENQTSAQLFLICSACLSLLASYASSPGFPFSHYLASSLPEDTQERGLALSGMPCPDAKPLSLTCFLAPVASGRLSLTFLHPAARSHSQQPLRRPSLGLSPDSLPPSEAP